MGLTLTSLCTKISLQENFTRRHVALIVNIGVLDLVQTEASRNMAGKRGGEEGFELCFDEGEVGDWVCHLFGDPV
jgi:hypothetical protein